MRHNVDWVGGDDEDAVEPGGHQRIDAFAHDFCASIRDGQPCFLAVSGGSSGDDRKPCGGGIFIAASPDPCRTCQRIGIGNVDCFGLGKRGIAVDQDDFTDKRAQH